MQALLPPHTTGVAPVAVGLDDQAASWVREVNPGGLRPVDGHDQLPHGELKPSVPQQLEEPGLEYAPRRRRSRVSCPQDPAEGGGSGMATQPPAVKSAGELSPERLVEPCGGLSGGLDDGAVRDHGGQVHDGAGQPRHQEWLELPEVGPSQVPGAVERYVGWHLAVMSGRQQLDRTGRDAVKSPEGSRRAVRDHRRRAGPQQCCHERLGPGLGCTPERINRRKDVAPFAGADPVRDCARAQAGVEGLCPADESTLAGGDPLQSRVDPFCAC